jgi:hypothetical protein
MGVFRGGLFGELMKIPQLIEHFNDHQERGSEVSFWTFMDMHYFSATAEDGDFPEDMKLPFKSSDSFGYSLSVTTLPSFSYELTHSYTSLLLHTVHESDCAISDGASQSVWQPPCL